MAAPSADLQATVDQLVVVLSIMGLGGPRKRRTREQGGGKRMNLGRGREGDVVSVSVVWV